MSIFYNLYLFVMKTIEGGKDDRRDICYGTTFEKCSARAITRECVSRCISAVCTRILLISKSIASRTRVTRPVLRKMPRWSEEFSALLLALFPLGELCNKYSCSLHRPGLW